MHLRSQHLSFVGLVAVLALVFATGCKGKRWVEGSWLFVDDNGKPGACFTFAAKNELTVYQGASCEGPVDKMASGKWQLKSKTKLAIQRGKEKVAQLAMITEHDDKHFVSRGTLAGTLHRVGEGGGEALLEALRKKGVVKIFPLPKAQGCEQLGLGLAAIRKLPKEKNPRMLRARDQGLEYRVNTNTGDPKIKKVIYALNQDQLDWVYIEHTAAAFGAPGPEGRLEKAIGKPKSSVSTGKGAKRQNIVMWKTYCASLHGQRNRDIDLTLFSTPGEKTAYYYLSEGVVSNIWENLRQMAADPAAQDDGSDDEGGDDGKGDGKKATKKASKKAEPATKASKRAEPATKVSKRAEPATKTAPTKSPAKATKPKAQGGVTAGGRPVVSGTDEDI